MYEAEDRHWWYVGLHELIIATVQRHSQRLGRPLKIFDAGCGTGRLCQLLAEKGHDVRGCDVSEEAIRFCLQRGVSTVFRSDLNTIELDAGEFDVITSIDVLYHQNIRDDVAVMKRLLTALKPNGILIINLVAFAFLRSTHDIAVHTRERYTRSLLTERLQSAGFGLRSVSYRVSFLFPIIALYRLLAKHRLQRGAATSDVPSDVALPHPFVNSLLLKTLRWENCVMLSGMPLPAGLSVFAVAVKTETSAVPVFNPGEEHLYTTGRQIIVP